MSKTIWDRIEESRSRRNVLDHPFYTRWSAGELSAEELAAYSGQYRYAVGAIARLSAAAADAAPDHPELREHAREESAHLHLWDGFVTEVGGDATTEPNPETAECARSWTGADGLLAKLVTLYAIESGQPEISRTKLAGLRDHYGVTSARGTTYFTVHERLDRDHAAQARELIEQLAGPDDADEVVRTAETAFEANWTLLDGVS